MALKNSTSQHNSYRLLLLRTKPFIESMPQHIMAMERDRIKD